MNLKTGPGCAADLFPRAALDAMVAESGAPTHDDGHTHCYYAGLLLAALPHLITDDMVERAREPLHGHLRIDGGYNDGQIDYYERVLAERVLAAALEAETDAS